MVSRDPHGFTHSPTTTGTPERVAVVAVPAGLYESYELTAVANSPLGSDDYGDLVLYWHESDPNLGPTAGAFAIPWRWEIDTTLAIEGPIRGTHLEIVYTAPASSVSPIDVRLNFVARSIEDDRSQENDGLALDHVFSSIAAGATSAYGKANILTGDALLLLAAPTRKGTFRVQTGGADLFDIAVAAGQTVHVPVNLGHRALSVRVANTDTAAGSYSARLTGAGH